MFYRIAVLTSKKSWFIRYAKYLINLLKKKGYKAKIFYNHQNISQYYELVFMLSYSNIVSRRYLLRHKHNLVVHASDLPRGKGWAPLFWQILENKNKIPVVLFEAEEKVDSGRIYLKEYIFFEGKELNEEIRKMQAEKTVELCLKFLNNYNNLRPKEQKARSTFYKRRIPEDSELDINKSLKSQFNLLRIVDNERFPAFFKHKGRKYLVKIFHDYSRSAREIKRRVS